MTASAGLGRGGRQPAIPPGHRTRPVDSV